MAKTCSVEGCGRVVNHSALCESHYKRLWRYGDPLGGGTFYGDAHKWVLEHLDYEGDECLIWPFSRKPLGYGEIRIDGKNESVHVVMCTIKGGPRLSEQHHTRHLCGNGDNGCVNPRHLIFGTRSENNGIDKVIHGTSTRGERHNMVKLTETDVLKIINDDRKYRVIANEYGVHSSTISCIKIGKSWSWLTGINPNTSA